MENREINIALPRPAMQLAMSFVNLPKAGEHSSIFITVGIAQHDLLLAPPGIEQARIRPRAPEIAADLWAGAQILDGFEERYGHDARVPIGRFDLNPGNCGEPHHIKDVLCGRGAADDVAANRLRRESSLQISNRARGDRKSTRLN